MFSIKKLNKIYNKIYNKTENVSFIERLLSNPYLHSIEYNKHDRLTEEQWQNLFDVCCIIEANYDRFNMRRFHDSNVCGTTHCIAGWAVAYEMNNPDFRDYNQDDNRYNEIVEKYHLNPWGDTHEIAEAMLSKFIAPFFYLYQGNAELFLYNDLILPVIEEGKKDGLILSPHAQEFILQSKQQ